VSRRTAKRKLTKLYWLSLQRSPWRIIVLLEPKRGGARRNKLYLALRARQVPPLSRRTGAPTFKFVLAPLRIPPLHRIKCNSSTTSWFLYLIFLIIWERAGYESDRSLRQYFIIFSLSPKLGLLRFVRWDIFWATQCTKTILDCWISSIF